MFPLLSAALRACACSLYSDPSGATLTFASRRARLVVAFARARVSRARALWLPPS